MIRNELEDQVASLMGRGKVVAHDAVNAVLGVIEAAIARGEEVRLAGFGSFAVSVRGASTGRNPRTGEALAIPEKRVVKFRPGRTLKDAAQNGQEAA